jgi:HAD superfamily hydrolase (TIGR01490 family)
MTPGKCMNLALFDFDGTIATRETFPDFMRFAVAPRRRAIGGVLLAPLVVGYRLGLVPGRVIRAVVVRVGFGGRRETEIRAAGERFARDVLPALVRPEALERIAWHRAQGDEVVVVSGGLELYLDAWCRQHGLPLIASRLAVRGGRLTGRYDGADCVGAEKPRRVRARYRLDDYAQVFAYGDTREDHAMLALAHRRWFRWRELAA